MPLIGPERDIVEIIEANYAEDGDGQYVDAEQAAREIVEWFGEHTCYGDCA